MKNSTLKKWLKERIDSIDKDIAMDKECKEEGRAIPFGDNNEKWVNAIKNRKEAFEEVIAHIECSELNKAYHLSIALEDQESKKGD